MPILEEHKEILATQSASKTLPEWIEFFDSQYTKNQIYSYCYHNHYPIKKLSKEDISKIQSNNARKYHINQDYFKTWSNNMAYIFGLWCADGCIYSGKMFDITLHTKDKYLLKQIAKELEYEGNLYDYVDKQASRINFSCVVIYNDIIKLGGTENKSITLQFPNIPKEYLPDFIRGYIDGDGSVYDVKGMRVNTTFTCGSRAFLNKLLQILKEEAGIQGGSFDDPNYSLRFGKKDSIKLFNYMYRNTSDELFLKRKKDRFLKYC